ADGQAILAASGQPARDLTMGLELTPDAVEPLPPLPDDLAQDLAQILADALHDDLTQYPELSEIPQRPDFTVASPSGSVRTRQRRARGRPSKWPARRLPRRGTSRPPALLRRDASRRIAPRSARDEAIGGADGDAFVKIAPPPPRKNARGPPTSRRI